MRSGHTGPEEGEEDLVPIRLDLKIDGTQIDEFFTWNTAESSLTPADFAALLVADVGLPLASSGVIAASITSQLNARASARANERTDPALLDDEDDDDNPPDVRQVIKLNIRVGRVVLRDQFEWDLSQTDNCPESFAETLCADLGLGRELVPAVAHGIREQLMGVGEFQRRRASCHALDARSVLRKPSLAMVWEPAVECLSVTEQDELERKEKREARFIGRQRRLSGVDKVGRPHKRRSTGAPGD
jgi:hypothetical protein